jgi:hypothetical protein
MGYIVGPSHPQAPCYPKPPHPHSRPATEEDEPLARQPSSSHLIAAGKLLLVLTDTQINFTGEQTADAGSLIVTAHEARMTSYLGYACVGGLACLSGAGVCNHDVVMTQVPAEGQGRSGSCPVALQGPVLVCAAGCAASPPFQCLAVYAGRPMSVPDIGRLGLLPPRRALKIFAAPVLAENVERCVRVCPPAAGLGVQTNGDLMMPAGMHGHWQCHAV